jgi:5-methyltetrahydrofolate--homocysteine methyltransferase
LVLDSAMGTRLIERGLDLARDDPALWDVTRPEMVRECHILDAQAGSDAVYTNTFGAHRARLAQLGRESWFSQIHRRAVHLAREAVGSNRFVIGCLGPRAVIGASPSSISPIDSYREQAALLSALGVDGFVLETLDARQALRAIAALRGQTLLPIFVSSHRLPASSTPTADRWARAFAIRGADAIGWNCVSDLDQLRAAVGSMPMGLDLPLLVKPAGRDPKTGATMSPTQLADLAATLVPRGARLFGGCCGTTELHVAALRSAFGPSMLLGST